MGLRSPWRRGPLSTRTAILLATLGTEPQVVTAGLTLLRRRGVRIGQVEVFHTHAPPILAARARLQAAFAGDAVLPPLAWVPLTPDQGPPLMDVITESDARAAFTRIYQHLKVRKAAGHPVHFLIAGGRKPLALLSMAAAQMLFDQDDRLWHLYSADAFVQSKRLFPRPDDPVQLVPVPVLPWHRLAPGFVALEGVEDPWQAVAQAWQGTVAERLAQARRFVDENLTPAERRVVALLVQEGLSDQDLAHRLHMSPKTISRHLSSAYAKAADFWQVPRVQRAQLVALLHGVFVPPRSPAANEDFSP